MTPEDYLKIYWDAYKEYGVKEIPGRNKIVQEDLMKYAIQKVVDAAKQEQVKEMADRYLNFSKH
jgi:hypothetical protein